MLYVSHSYGRGKCRYGVCSNLWYCLRTMWEWKKVTILIITLGFVPFLAANYAATLLPAMVVRDLEGRQTLEIMVSHIGMLCLAMWLGEAADSACMIWMERSMPGFLQHIRKKFTSKIMDLDYELLEDKESREIIGNVTAAIRHGRGLYT